MADTSTEFLIDFFVNYLPFTPTSGQVDDFRRDLSLVSPYLMKAALVEIKNGSVGKKLQSGKDWRPAIFQVYNRKVAEHAQFFSIFQSFETAFRSTAAVTLEEHYRSSKWWTYIYETIRKGNAARSVTTLCGKPIATDTAHSIGELIFAIDGENFQRNIVGRCNNGFQFLEHCDLAGIARLIENHWSIFGPKFERGKNRLSLDHFKKKIKVVRDARNDIYHHKSIARMTDVVKHAEDLLDYLNFSLQFAFEKIENSAPQLPRFVFPISARHRTW